MRVLHLLSEFPVRSQTFVLDQLVGQRALGAQLCVVARRRGEPMPIGPEGEALLAEAVFLEEIDDSVSLPGRLGFRARELAAALGRRPMTLLRGLSSRGVSVSMAGRVSLSARVPSFDSAVVHAHFGPNGLLAIDMARMGLVRAPIVTTFYGYDVDRYPAERGSGVYARLFADARLILALSNSMRGELIARGCPAEKIRVHHLGVHPGHFAERPRHRSAGPVRLLTVARLVEKKGFDDAIRALARIANTADFVYTIVGDGPERGALESLAAASGLAGRVRFAGAQPRDAVREELASADIFLHPSVTARNGEREGTPTAILEAMAAGLPVVATRHAGIPEQVIDGETGLLVAERDTEALAAALDRLIASESQRFTMGQAGVDHVRREFDIDLLNARLLDLYKEITGVETRGGATA